MEKSRDAADAANIRAAYAEATAAYITDESATKKTKYAYNFSGQGTDAKWSQGDDFEIAGIKVTAMAKAKSVEFILSDSGVTKIELKDQAVASEGAQAQ